MKTENLAPRPVPLSLLTRIICAALGLVLLIAAARLFSGPPIRHTTTTETTTSSDAIATTRNDLPADPGAVVITLLTAGAAIIAFGLNGIRITRFSSPIGDFSGNESTNTEIPLPRNDEGAEIEQPPLEPSPNIGAAHGAATDGARALEGLVWPMIPASVHPGGLIPGAAIPASSRDLPPGQVITWQRGGLQNHASVFFFSHDAMICFSALLTNAHRRIAAYAARQAAHHLTEIGFGSTPFRMQLNGIAADCDNLAAEDWTPDRRARLAAEVLRLTRTVGSIIQSAQNPK